MDSFSVAQDARRMPCQEGIIIHDTVQQVGLIAEVSPSLLRSITETSKQRMSYLQDGTGGLMLTELYMKYHTKSTTPLRTYIGLTYIWAHIIGTTPRWQESGVYSVMHYCILILGCC